MARFSIVREERARIGTTWFVAGSQTMDTGAPYSSVVQTMQDAHSEWLGDNPNRRIVVHEWKE